MNKNDWQMNFEDEMANRENRGNRNARFLRKLEARGIHSRIMQPACAGVRA